MPRSQRFLTAANTTMKYTAAAPPPEAVALESDFVVILAALLCAVICVVGLLSVARCAWLRRTPGGGRAGGPVSAQASSANKGLKKKVLQQLPKFTYGDGGPAAPPKMGSECAICLGEFAEGDEIRALPQCGHVFHVGCIDTWLGSHSSCPSCRHVLVVARCHKCGNFPAIPEAEPKTQQDHIYHSAPPPPSAAATTTCSSSTDSNSNSNSNSDSNSNAFLP
ncbi:RING-H2 finger protein ATL8-like [Argentina anserina]|uniref:RING-H2 finger protein ATL8-like n=1 Tax=Argentina anserina TaxID=57926 RepID=UPI00217648BB|nr:RING-H2 finger protein ATL8-like [Potentilla anserina]